MGEKQDREEGFFIRRDADGFRAAALITVPSVNLLPVKRKMIPQRLGKRNKVSKSSMNLVLVLRQDVCARVSAQLH